VAWNQSDALEYQRLPAGESGRERRHVLNVPAGCEFSVRLSDGTLVRLNAGSTLTYPDQFAPGSREVMLSGEAYFEVTPDTLAPFRVYAGEMALTVLGTAFDLSAYPDEGVIVTTLVSGRVHQRFGELEMTLAPGESAICREEDGTMVKVAADIEEALAWKEGRFIARHRSLEDIFRMLGKWYNFEVVYLDPSLKDVHFYLNIKRYEDIREVLENLSSTNGVTLTYTRDVIYVSR
jgi:ferric-dicitrate binding protein FerR (iron transport regulator)